MSAAIDHARGDRFAVQPVAVARGGLDRMTERVAEIQDRAQSLLAFVDGRRPRP